MMRCPAETHSVDSSEADAQDRISERDAEGNGSEMEEDSLNPSLTEASYTTRVWFRNEHIIDTSTVRSKCIQGNLR